MTIRSIIQEYRQKLDHLDLELLLGASIGKSREFVLAHPEYELQEEACRKFKEFAERRMAHEPIAYILGHKEFYGLDFKVNRHTLIPRPETEMMVELALGNISKMKEEPLSIIDVGTGSGNIITSIATASVKADRKINFFAVDISEEALRVAKHNAKANHVDKKIKFIQSDLLSHFILNTRCEIRNTIILANLPYLSEKIYSETMPDVKDFEPKSALYSPSDGLFHYEELLGQIKMLNERSSSSVSCAILEISPEQKPELSHIIENILPESRARFEKDLSGRWRMCLIDIIEK